MWIQVRMPDYSLNWTARSSDIQTCQGWSSPTQMWSRRRRGPFGLKSAFAGQRPLGSKPTGRGHRGTRKSSCTFSSNWLVWKDLFCLQLLIGKRRVHLAACRSLFFLYQPSLLTTAYIKSTKYTYYPQLKTPNLYKIWTPNVFLISSLGDATISFGFRKNFHTNRMVVEPKNKDKN